MDISSAAKIISKVVNINYIVNQSIEIVAFPNSLVVLYRNDSGGAGRIEEYSAEHLQNVYLRKTLPLYDNILDYPLNIAST